MDDVAGVVVVVLEIELLGSPPYPITSCHHLFSMPGHCLLLRV